MKPLPLIGLCLALASTRALAQDRPADPKNNTLVECGSDHVAIFGGTESKDNHYAVGWTLRPARGKKPVDWAAYKSDDVRTWLEQYPTSDDNTPADYVLVDGVLDLRAKKFTPLPTKYPFFNGQNRRDLNATWSREKHGSRRAVIDLDNDWSSFTFLLAEVGPGGVHFIDLKTPADHAVSAFLRPMIPHSYKRYVVGYGGYAGKHPAALDTEPMQVPFEAQVPKMEDPVYDGHVMVTFAGKVVGVTAKKSAQ